MAFSELGFDLSATMPLPGGRSETMVEAIDRVFEEMDDDDSGTIEYHELNKALSDEDPEVELMDLKDVTTQLSLAEVASASRQRTVQVTKAVRASLDLDLITQLANGLLAKWAYIADRFASSEGADASVLSRRDVRELPWALGIVAHPLAPDALFAAIDIERCGLISFQDLTTAVRASLSHRAVQTLGSAERTQLPPLNLEGHSMASMAFSSSPSSSPLATSRSPRNYVGSPRGQRTVRIAPLPLPIQIRKPCPPAKKPTPPPSPRQPKPASIRRLALRVKPSPRLSPREMDLAWFEEWRNTAPNQGRIATASCDQVTGGSMGNMANGRFACCTQ